MEGTGNQPGLLLLAGEVEEIGGFWKERGLIPHPSSSPACRYDTRSPSDTWALQGVAETLLSEDALGYHDPGPLLSARGAETEAAGEGILWPGLDQEGPALNHLRALSLTLFTGKRCSFRDAPSWVRALPWWAARLSSPVPLPLGFHKPPWPSSAGCRLYSPFSTSSLSSVF